MSGRTTRTDSGTTRTESRTTRTDRSAPAFRTGPHPDPVPLSRSQERLWFLLHLNRGMRAYQFQATFELNGALDATALAQALTEVVRRHEVYRTTFADGRDGPRQIVHPPFPVELPVEDLCDAADPEEAARAVVREAVRVDIPFDRLPLVNWRLLRTGSDRHVLLHLEHHLIHDGWGFNVFVEELCALYGAYAQGLPSPLPEPALQFADYAVWQREWLQSADAERQRAFWTQQLDGVPPYFDLPTDRPRTARRRFTGDTLRVTVPARVADEVRDLARRERVSLFTVMLAAFQVLLHGWSGKDDFCLGTGIAGRGRPETQNLLGMLVNTVALRADLRDALTFREVLTRVRATTLGAVQHQELPFDQVVAALRPPRVPGRQPLSEVMFAFHDSPLGAMTMPGLDVSVTVGVSNGSAKFDLSVVAIPRAEQAVGKAENTERDIELVWEYDHELFDAETVAWAARRYEELLAAVAADPHLRLAALTAPPEER
ncbi:condensation domain-containing protein [Streptomyces sp. NPDC041068]|uniref:condensation domain-containing protein n=1 Tax=Streptomyces sp. NPDC041068 TaxID=3155130 RepID=UPI003406D97C